MNIKYNLINAGKFDFVFSGATFLAAGAACELAEKGYSCLIYDRLALPGHEFASALKGGCPSDASTQRGKALLDELYRRNAIMPNGNPNYAALSPLLCQELKKSNITYYPFANAEELTEKDNEFELTLSCHGCRVSLTTDCIIDTSNGFEIGSLFGIRSSVASCHINAVTATGNDIGMLSLPVADGENWRKSLFDFVLSGKLGDSRLILPADEPDMEITDSIDFVSNRFMRAASTSFPDAISAFDAGAKLALRLSNDADRGYGTLPEPAASISDGDYDLIVVGLGTAGAVCALTAARYGLKVLGIDKMTFPGGTGTAGAVFSYYQGRSGGYYTATDDRAAELQKLGFVSERGNGAVSKSFALEEALRAAGVTCIMSADFTNVIRDSDNPQKITGIGYIHEGKHYTAKAETVADASGDGIVCLAAGCEMLGGRETDNAFQIYSDVLRLYNRESGIGLGKYADDGRVFQYNPENYGKAVINSFLSPLFLPEKYRVGKFLRLPPAPLPGLREGAKIIGEETVCLSDITHRKQISNPAFFEHVNLDNHGKDIAFEDREFRDWIEICSLWDASISIPVPTGALIPLGYKGLLAIGRCLSVDHSTALAVRMKHAMQKCGEAGAIMAFHAKRLGCPLSEVPYETLEKDFYKSGILKSNEIPYAVRHSLKTEEIFNFSNDPCVLHKLLSENNAGAAIRELSVRPEVKPLLESFCREGGRLALNSSLTLSLMPDCCETAKSILTQFVSDVSGDTPDSSYTFNIPYAIAAISAVGRCRIAEATDPLIKIITSSDYTSNIPINCNYEIKTGLFYCSEDVRTIWFISALTALCDIAEAHPELRLKITKAVEGLSGETVCSKISLIGQPDSYKMNLSSAVDAVTDRIISMKGTN